MSEWKTIGEIAEIYDGPHATPKKIENGYYFLSISSLLNGKLDLSKSSKICEEDYKKWTKRIVPIEGDLLFSYETRLGEAALMPANLQACLGRRMGLLRPNLNFVRSDFLLFAWLSPEFQKVIKQNTITGATVERIALSELSDFPILLPSLLEQEKIVKILTKLDQKIALNNQINEELEAMAKTLYDYWFVQFDFPDENGKPYKSSGGKMVYNDQLKREIPEGWGVDSLWNIATFYNGLAMQKFRPASETDESLPVIKIREMFSGFSKDTEKASTAIPKEAIIEAGDILFSWSATLEVILWGGEKGALNQHIFKVTSEKYPKSFIYNELRSYLKVFKTIAELRKTTMGHITQDHLKQAMIIVPPSDLIDEIDNRISLILKQQLDLKQQNQELTQLRDWLLPMLMNGQARVK